MTTRCQSEGGTPAPAGRAVAPPEALTGCTGTPCQDHEPTGRQAPHTACAKMYTSAVGVHTRTWFSPRQIPTSCVWLHIT